MEGESGQEDASDILPQYSNEKVSASYFTADISFESVSQLFDLLPLTSPWSRRVLSVANRTTWKRPAEALIVGVASASVAAAVAASSPSSSRSRSNGGGDSARVHISRSGSVDIDAGATRLRVGRRRGGAGSSAPSPSAEAIALAERNVELWGAGGDEQARVVIPRIHWAMEGSDSESDGESGADFAALERKYINAALRKELLAASDSEEEEAA